MRLLLLGSTGAVGAGCLDALVGDESVSIVLAGRDDARLRSTAQARGADIEVVRIDAFDAAAVTAAGSRCDVVVNCAGPSHQLSPTVAAGVMAAEVPYVDAGGDQALLDVLTLTSPGVPAILQAGVQPGLSGLLLRALAERTNGNIDQLSVWCGGLQHLTPASVQEYLASLDSPHGRPGVELRGGQIQRVRGDACGDAPQEYFPGGVSVHPHLDAETLAVASQLGIPNVFWSNVLDGPRTKSAMHVFAAEHGRPGEQPDPRDVLKAARLDLFGRQPYFAIIASAIGDFGNATVAATCTDSYRVTGALAAYAARRVVDMSAGVYPFWKIERPWEVIDHLAEAAPDFQARVVDGSAGGCRSEELSPIEEGSL